MSLALRYRPRTFADVTGQKLAVVPLYRMARLGTLDKPLLLAGVRGCGKTSTARILGAALNCESADQTADKWPCGSCPSCEAVAAGNSLDVIEVDAASNGGVDAVRELRQIMSYGSPGAWKVLLLDEVHAMSRDAFNALLKILEEPHDHTLFILLTTEPGKILPTVMSRCMTFTFRRIPPALIAARLEHICALEDIKAEPALLAEIADRADGGMRDAVMLLDQAASTLAVEGLTLANFEKVFGAGDYVLPAVAAMVAGDYPAVYAALEDALVQAGEPSAVIGKLADLLADLLVLRSGGAVTTQGTPLEARKALAARLDVPRLTRAMKALWDYQTRVKVADRQAALKLAAVVVTEQLCPPRPQAHPGQPPVNGVMPCNGARGQNSLDDLKAALGALCLISVTVTRPPRRRCAGWRRTRTCRPGSRLT
jgi:DNA polymerase-3 subunit gamma/tau